MIEIKGKFAKKKIKVLDQLEVKLKKFTVNDLFRKDTKVQRLNSIEDMGEIEEIKCLMVNWGSICINPKSCTTMKKALKFRVDIEVWQG